MIYPEEVMDEMVSGLIELYTALWYSLPDKKYTIGKKILPITKIRNRIRTKSFVKFLNSSLQRANSPGHTIRRRRIIERAYSFGIDVPALDKNSMAVLTSGDFISCTHDFMEMAHRFNPSFSLQEIFQGLRNVWVMNAIQLFLNKKIDCPPPVFAYSLLYPYTDNYLDTPGITAKTKAAFIRRLGQRLAGHWVGASNPLEKDIFTLVGMIEAYYPRRKYPGVYNGLMRIHRAQTKSIKQHKENLSTEELLRITIEKGGSSVLADAYLVKGELTEQETSFYFGLGVVTQIIDDLQDLAEDKLKRQQTLFTSQSTLSRGKLVNKLFRLLEYLIGQAKDYQVSEYPVLENLLFSGCKYLILEGVTRHDPWFKGSFLREISKYTLFPAKFQMKAGDHIAETFSGVDVDRICMVLAEEPGIGQQVELPPVLRKKTVNTL